MRAWPILAAVFMGPLSLLPGVGLATAASSPLALNTAFRVVLPSGSWASYDVGADGGLLTVALASGDVGVSLQDDDQTTSMQTGLMGAGESDLVLGPTSGGLYHLTLNTFNGADLTVSLGPADSAPPGGQVSVSSVSTETSSSTLSQTTVVSSSSTNGTVSTVTNGSSTVDVRVSGGDTATAPGGRIRINNGRVQVTGGQ